MASKVKDTPILMGKEAKAFSKAIKDNMVKKIPSEDFKRAQSNFKRIQLA